MKKKAQSQSKSLETINHNSTELLGFVKNEFPKMTKGIEDLNKGMEKNNAYLFKIIFALIALIAGLVGVKVFV